MSEARAAEAENRIEAVGRCEAALEHAAAAHNVPRGLLTAIARARQERVPASQFAVNIDGWRKVFLDLQLAKRGVLRLHSVGEMRLGCALLSWSGNQEHFKTYDRLFDQKASAEYLAQYLSDQYAKTKSWSKAVASIHQGQVWNAGRPVSILCDIARRFADLQSKDHPNCD